MLTKALLSCFLLASCVSAQAPSFPGGWVPFAYIYQVTKPNQAGDRLVVGMMSTDNFNGQYTSLPRPTAANQVFSDAQINLAPGRFFQVYVPTDAEKRGDFSPFAGLLLDPASARYVNGALLMDPFPGGIIPASRKPSVYAFRVKGDEMVQVHFSGTSNTGTAAVSAWGRAGLEVSSDSTNMRLFFSATDVVEFTLTQPAGSSPGTMSSPRGLGMFSGVKGSASFTLTESSNSAGVSSFSGAGSGFLTTDNPLPVTPNTYLGAFAHIVYGPIAGTVGASWKTSLVIMNTGGSPQSVRVHFFNAAGSEVAVPVVGRTRAVAYDLTVKAGGSVTLELDDTQEYLPAGWASLEPLPGTSFVSPDLRAQGIYRQRAIGRPDYEAVAPAVIPDPLAMFGRSTPAVLEIPFDNTEGFTSAFAFANVTGTTLNMQLQFVDENGANLLTRPINLGPASQTAFATGGDGYAPVVNRRGVVRVLAGQNYFSAVGFRFNPSGAFSTLIPINR